MNLDQVIPFSTDRLLLDRFNPEDWEHLYRIEISPEQHKYNFESFTPKSQDEIKAMVMQLSRQNYNERNLPFLLAIRLITNKELTGFIGFKNGRLQANQQIEVYYSIYRDFWNKGYGTEALKAMISFGFDIIKLHKIFAGCDIGNAASRAIMEKAGMRFESRWRKDRIRNGKWTDGLGFAILAEDRR